LSYGSGIGALGVFFDTLQWGARRQALSLGAIFTILPCYTLQHYAFLHFN